MRAPTSPPRSHPASRRPFEDGGRPLASSLPLDAGHAELIDQSHDRCAALGVSRIERPDLSLLGTVRTDWTLEEARAVYTAPFSDLLFHAQRVHRDHFVPNSNS